MGDKITASTEDGGVKITLQYKGGSLQPFVMRIDLEGENEPEYNMSMFVDMEFVDGLFDVVHNALTSYENSSK